MAYHLLLALLGIGGLFAGWVAVERLTHGPHAASTGALDAAPDAPQAAGACTCCAVPCGVRPAEGPAQPHVGADSPCTPSYPVGREARTEPKELMP